MNSKYLAVAAALAMIPAGTALAQTSAAPTTPPAATAPSTAAPSAAASQPSATAATPVNPVGPITPATKADITAGATVFDSKGMTVGTVESVTANGAVVSSGKLRAELPVASFAKNSNGLVIGVTKAEFEAAVNRAES